jgi:hypothetical protein
VIALFRPVIDIADSVPEHRPGAAVQHIALLPKLYISADKARIIL